MSRGGDFTIRPAVRDRLFTIGGFIGGTGSGKTFTALRVATGLAQRKRFLLIDTEARRSLHYADQFEFDHLDLTPPFTPERYLEAILLAESKGYPVAVVDSTSHEHAGEGGILDWHEEELQRLAGDDYRKREKMTFAAWIKPKMSHKRMVARLLQLRMHLILCFRAEEKVKAKKKNGKTEWEAVGWQPICATGLEYELTYSFLLRHEHPGIYKDREEGSEYGHAIKLPGVLRPFFPAGELIAEASGQKVAAWAAGDSELQAASAETVETEKVSEEQLAELEALKEEIIGKKDVVFYRWLEATHHIKKLEDLPAAKYDSVCRALARRRSQSAS